jgi:hypothetical protein
MSITLNCCRHCHLGYCNMAKVSPLKKHHVCFIPTPLIYVGHYFKKWKSYMQKIANSRSCKICNSKEWMMAVPILACSAILPQQLIADRHFQRKLIISNPTFKYRISTFNFAVLKSLKNVGCSVTVMSPHWFALSSVLRC